MSIRRMVMKKRPSLAIAIIFSLFIAAPGQNPQQPSSPSSTPRRQQDPLVDDEVVRITTNLVQVDAVITDKDGKLVTDLKPEEVEILEDGRPQTITNFSFVSVESAPQPGPP